MSECPAGETSWEDDVLVFLNRVRFRSWWEEKRKMAGLGLLLLLLVIRTMERFGTEAGMSDHISTWSGYKLRLNLLLKLNE